MERTCELARISLNPSRLWNSDSQELTKCCSNSSWDALPEKRFSKSSDDSLARRLSRSGDSYGGELGNV